MIAALKDAKTNWMKEKTQAVLVRKLILNAWTVFRQDDGESRAASAADFSSALKYWLKHKNSDQWHSRGWDTTCDPNE